MRAWLNKKKKIAWNESNHFTFKVQYCSNKKFQPFLICVFIHVTCPQQMLWVKSCWHHFELIDFVPTHTSNFRRYTKSTSPSPVESIVSCLRKVHHSFCCTKNDFGGDCGHYCAIIDCVFFWQVRNNGMT